MSTTFTSKQYQQFVFVKGNRPIANRVRVIAKSMKANNLLDAYPIVCVRLANGKLGIMDGQHRFKAAQTLGLPIHYKVVEKMTVEQVAQLNSTQKKWTPSDYLRAHAGEGKPDYVALVDFVDRNKFPISVAIAICSENDSMAHGGERLNAFRTGKFVMGNTAHAEKVAEAVNIIKKFHGWATARCVVLAISKLVKTKAFDVKRFAEKLSYQSTRFVKCADYMQYVALIDDIYNFKCIPRAIVSLTAEVKKLR